MFIANILTPLKESVNELLSDKLAPVINQLVDTSRIAIMDNYGNIRIFGSGWEEQDGIYYSNSGYKEHKWVTTYTCSNGKTYQYSYDDYDDDYDDYYSGKKTKTKGNWKNYTTSYQELVEQFGSWDNYFAWRNLEDNEKVEELARMYPDDADWIFDYYDEGNTSPEELREWLYDTYEIK